jgi:hypothetical protein
MNILFFEAFMTVGKAPTASQLPKTKGDYKRMYMGRGEGGIYKLGVTIYNLPIRSKIWECTLFFVLWTSNLRSDFNLSFQELRVGAIPSK